MPASASGGLGLGEEALGVLLHQAVQRGLLGAVALAVHRRAIRRPVGLSTDSLHACSRRDCGAAQSQTAQGSAIAQRDAYNLVTL